MNPEAKKILNKIRCPFCGSQLDLIDLYKSSGDSRIFNFVCVSNLDHYKIFFNHWDDPPSIESESVVVFSNERQFTILQKDDCTRIMVRKVDGEGRLLDNVKQKDFKYDKYLFDFKNLNQDKIIKRIKTILTFQ